MKMTISTVPWEKLFTDEPAFLALPIEYRHAFFQLKPSGNGQPLATPAVQFLCKHGWADAGVVQPLVSERRRQFHEILHLGNASNDLTNEPAASRYLHEVWGCNHTQFLQRLRVTSISPWTTERMFLAYRKGLFTRIARVAPTWDFSNLGGTDTRQISHSDWGAVRALGQKFLQWIEDSAKPLTLAAVVHYLPRDFRAAMVLRWTTQNLALFLGYDDRRGEVTLGLHPQTYIQRQQPSLVRPQAVSGLSLTSCAPRCDDVLLLLTAVALEPLQFRQDGELMAREITRLAVFFTSVPASDINLYQFLDRLKAAIFFARHLKFLKPINSKNQYEVSSVGLSWLALSPGLRQHSLLAWLRELFVSDPAGPARSSGDTAKFYVFSSGHFDQYFLHSSIVAAPYVADALRALGAETWRLVDAVRWWGYQVPANVDRSLVSEAECQEMLRRVIVQAFLPFGLIAVHGTGDDTHIALTDAGRWMVGLTPTWTPPHEETMAQPLIVQADHTVIFLAQAPALEVEIGRFAERCPGATGTGVLFRFTKGAVHKGVAGGLNSEQAIAVLQGASAKPLPANIVRELTTWFGQVRHITAGIQLVVEAPDEETALRVCTLIGKTARRISPLIVLLPKTMTPSELSRKTLKAGIMLKEKSKIDIESA